MWAIAMFLAVLIVPHMTRAATFVVDSSADEVDVVPGDGVCRSASGRCTLRAAVLEANALAGTDSIVLLEGRYRLVLPGADEDAGYTGDLDITDDLVLNGVGEATTIVDGSHIDRVFDVHSPAHLTAAHITITNGEPPGYESGGGMSNDGTINLSNVTFVRNHAGRDNGFVGGLDNLGTAVLTHVTFSHNSAARACPSCYGGEAGDIGAMQNRGTATLVSVTFRANHAGDGVRNWHYDGLLDGGNIGAFANFGSATLTDVAFLSNRAGDGAGGEHGVGGDCGALWNEGNATLTRVSFTGNRAGDGGNHDPFRYAGYGEPGDGGSGGAIYNNSGTIILSDVSISHNRAGHGGRGGPSQGGWCGAICNFDEATLNNVTLDKNRAGSGHTYGGGGSGGAILAWGTTALTNVTITRNRAGDTAGWAPDPYDGLGNGGGMEILGQTTLKNVTIALNRCGRTTYGGREACLGNQIDVYEGPIQLTNTIVYGRGQSCSDPVVSLGHNIDSGTTCGLMATGDLANTNPRLATLGSNGGFSKTMKLLPWSPAIDAGDNGACPATDQRGVTRPQGGGCDIGAYEFP